VILTGARNPPLFLVYIDAFAGSGTHISRATKRMVRGSPLNALSVEPPFREFHFIDIAGDKVAALRGATRGRNDVFIYHGDSNAILLSEIFPRVRYEDYRRGLCLLDPYGLHLDWEVIHTAGRLRTIDMFLNFPTMDMNMNVLWSDPERPAPEQRERMNRYWGDESWRTAAYNRQQNLLDMELNVQGANDAVADAFRDRLRTVAGFRHVPSALPMRNSAGAVVYYLMFASQEPRAAEIVDYIFRKYRRRLR
jgi:three-Cys-motif partner protein